MPGEVLGDRLMSETNILVDRALDDTQIQSVRQALAELGAAGAQPFETLTGEFEAHPYQLSGPLLVVPAGNKVPYLLTTHWSSADHFNAWKSSSSYRALQSLGDVSSELFVPLVETRPREHLRDDKLQRDWEWMPEDRRRALAAPSEFSRRTGGVIGQQLTAEGSSAEGKQLLAAAKLNNNARKVPPTTTRRMS